MESEYATVNATLARFVATNPPRWQLDALRRLLRDNEPESEDVRRRKEVERDRIARILEEADERTRQYLARHFTVTVRVPHLDLTFSLVLRKNEIDDKSYEELWREINARLPDNRPVVAHITVLRFGGIGFRRAVRMTRDNYQFMVKDDGIEIRLSDEQVTPMTQLFCAVCTGDTCYVDTTLLLPCCNSATCETKLNTMRAHQ